MAATAVTLTFDKDQVKIGGETDIRQGLSAVVLEGDHLWLACDEGCRLERLSASATAKKQFDAHVTFPLHDLLPMPAGSDEEADVEGLAVDDEWLWLVGSHSVKRKRARDSDAPDEIAARLARTGRDGNRHLLGRVPLKGGTPSKKSGDRRAGTIACTKKTSALLDAIVDGEDEHLLPFAEVPGKDNGFDLEGLAVRGDRVFVGLRGPVLREWCCVLELSPEGSDDGHLELAPMEGRNKYRKHFLNLNGLGVRDLVLLDDDLLVLAGPTMAHDGPVEIWRWKGAAKKREAAGIKVERLMEVPHGRGTDRAEGFTLFEQGASRTSVLVVFDTPAPERLVGKNTVRADVFRLP